MARNPWILFFVSLVKVKKLRSLVRKVTRKIGKAQPDGFEAAVPRTIPRNIWMFWDKGIDEAPEVVKMCIASWQAKNPGWTIRVLDRNTVKDFVDLPPLSPEMSIQSYSNILRFKLLKDHGGVWADATAFCIKPLDEWLPIVGQRGFFAFFWTPETRWFTWPGYTREVATWFLAAEPGSPIMVDWYNYSVRYWEKRQKPHLYFWCQTLFELLIYMRRPFRRAWRQVPKIGCLGPHLVHDCVIRNRDTARIARILDNGAAPVQKLRWQWDKQKLAIAKSLLHVDETEPLKRPKAV
ncbi:capsular polysaccharide synthesis protein [Ruegeria sp. 6PALISEP08]|uniref:capsular polysaccharide synthesis protein n=1 Tax=Ruegeria sp. 6PALISEP08 TaxID=1225660 RepID=UPI000A5F0CA8|nr:capsular polysaccharide synthesis protein [Ruegeria sp. 6PALISEP08]